MTNLLSIPAFVQLSMFLIIVGAILTVLAVIELMGMWCLLQKMGRHDFAALIPGYNLWEYARGAGLRPGLCSIFMLVLIAFAVCASIHSQMLYSTIFVNPIFGVNLLYALAADPLYALSIFLNVLFIQIMIQLQALNPWLIASLVLLVVYLIFFVVIIFGVSKSFGHGVLFMIGMLILPFIFIPILGFSKKQRYYGPHFDKELRGNDPDKWATAVQSRLRTFGSNAPLALALIGLALTLSLMSIPALVLYVIAFVRNLANRGKPLAKAKYGVTIAVIIVGIIVSLVTAPLMLSIGNSIIGLPGLF